MREVRHDNINAFIGVCIENTGVYILSEYCSRGSLRDVLDNVEVHLDSMFIASLTADILSGIIFIHESPVRYHGKIRPSNCLIDSRWVLKLTDWGLHELRSCFDRETKNCPYRAPELLSLPATAGTQAGDVYSFGIILYELHERRLPSSLNYDAVDTPQNLPLFLLNCIRDCCCEDPKERPDFKSVRSRLRPLRNGM